MNLLREMFDKSRRPVAMVSSYDNSITYCNEAAASLMGRPVSALIGVSAEGVLNQSPVLAGSPLRQCLASADHGREHGRGEDGSWWVASAVPCADPISPEIFGTGHWSESLDHALAEHQVLCMRAAVAMEQHRCQRLLTAAVAASGDAQRRLDFMSDLLAETGRMPINPVGAPATPV